MSYKLFTDFKILEDGFYVTTKRKIFLADFNPRFWF